VAKEMTRRTGLWLSIAAGGMLALVVGIQHISTSSRGTDSSLGRRGPLSKLLPAQLENGTVRDEPIAASDEMKKAVGELLNFNDGLFRIYQLPDARVSVYVAWWEAGRMSPRLVATHTPDVCWPGNGWTRDQTAEGGLGSLSEELRTKGFAQGECRVFSMQNKPEYVVFWHKVGDEMLSYGTGFAPPWWAWIDEMWRGGLNLRNEQLFVRISSDKPLEKIWGKPEIEPLRKALLDLGLRAKREGQGAK
jgi:hypothetical protein